MKAGLNKGGIFFAETTNAAIFSGFYMLANDFTHWQYFTEWSFKEVLVQAGFNDVEVFGKKSRARSIKYLIWLLLRSVWFCILRFIYWLERGRDQNPTIFAKSLMAVCRNVELNGNIQ